MRRKVFSIWSVLLILIVSVAVLGPACNGDGACTGEIEVKATLCDAPWSGAVQYTLTGPGAAAPTVVNGTAVAALFDNADCGNWTCAYFSGGPPGANLVGITPSETQELSGGGTITFTLNFELEQDAWIDWLNWTIDGEVWQGSEVEVGPCQIIDVHFGQGVDGCEGRIVAINETSKLWIHYLGWTDMPMGEPMCGIVPDPVLYVVNDLCAVNKTAEPPANPPEKVSQMTSLWGEPIPPPNDFPLICCEETLLDVETIWMLEKEIDYIKSINWLGISLFEPLPHPCVLFELVLPMPVPGWYVFELVAEAEVALMDDEDVNIGNNKDMGPPLLLTVVVAP